ncbi:hypothetical protein Afil01_30000 [Actinorhabdospora filicis]|uniref:Uncharacterized protein n=1 Tax=Actinorhabdospora filicis TaxID=1785913 RepID=A0A9W6SLH8_9ACTN|nr:hypothetical protein Afil01_30000 [Actinorhabdospora filicis]
MRPLRVASAWEDSLVANGCTIIGQLLLGAVAHRFGVDRHPVLIEARTRDLLPWVGRTILTASSTALVIGRGGVSSYALEMTGSVAAAPMAAW